MMSRPPVSRSPYFRSPFVLALAAVLAVLVAVRLWVVRVDAARGDLQPRPELLVSPEWLAAHLDDPALRIVDLRGPEDYAAAHVPGAVHLPAGTLYTERDGVKGMLPETAALEAAIRQAGIAPDHTVVAYDANDGLLAARLFMALDVNGHPDARLLDGGWVAWRGGDHPVSSEPVTPQPTDWVARPRPGAVAELEWMRAHVGASDAVFVDARSSAEYLGERSGSRRSGRIPGAISMEWKNNLDDQAGKRFKSREELLADYEALGVTPDKTVASYCQSETRGAHTYFTLRWLGYPDVRAYDGSWHEWGNRDDTPIETGPPQSAAPPAGAGDGGGTVAAPESLQPGITQAEAQALLGPPDAREVANPCWGRQAIWTFRNPRVGQGPLELVFLDGVLSEIRR